MSAKTIRFIPIAMLVLVSCGPSPEDVTAADRVFLNGEIYTVDENRSWAEAIAIKGGRIVYVGDNTEAGRRIGETTQVTDLRRQMMLPGFHDSHIHIMIGVMDDLECSLLRLETVEDITARLKECTSLTGIGDDGWIIGGGWGEWLWPEANPQKGLLDLMFPDQPVYLESSFGHAAWVNSKA
ncbi:MAG: amidohydrolase family protein, partial [Gammaproteobacteria bacterium]|nr:amidohydrolase family protein [Gammaproteobacteria bacterium]